MWPLAVGFWFFDFFLNLRCEYHFILIVTDKKFSAIFWQEMKIQIPQRKISHKGAKAQRNCREEKKKDFLQNQEQFYEYHPFTGTLKIGKNY